MSVENTDLLPECREHTNMLKRVLAIFENELLATVACEDATHTFTALGLEQERARELFAYIQNIFLADLARTYHFPILNKRSWQDLHQRRSETEILCRYLMKNWQTEQR